MEDWVWVVIPVLALMIPIVVVLTKHQQKMAEILHGTGNSDSNELEAVRRELKEIKALLHQQSITLDSVLNSQKALPSEQPSRPNLTERLSASPD